MAPINFEDRMREELEKRRIEPSAESWEKLSARLDDSAKISRKPRWWMAVAAVLLLALLAGGIYFRPGNPVAPAVVDGASKEPVGNGEFQPATEIASEETVENSQFQPASEVTSSDSTKYEGDSDKDGQVKAAKTEVASAVASEEKGRREISPILSSALKRERAEEVLLPQKTEEIIAKTGKNAATKTVEVSDAEVEALLAEANAKMEKQTDMESKAVTGRKLLAEMEDNEQESIKMKAFEYLKEGFQKAKSAVVQRNE